MVDYSGDRLVCIALRVIIMVLAYTNNSIQSIGLLVDMTPSPWQIYTTQKLVTSLQKFCTQIVTMTIVMTTMTTMMAIT